MYFNKTLKSLLSPQKNRLLLNYIFFFFVCVLLNGRLF